MCSGDLPGILQKRQFTLNMILKIHEYTTYTRSEHFYDEIDGMVRTDHIMIFI
jgi:hypothetical protein